VRKSFATAAFVAVFAASGVAIAAANAPAQSAATQARWMTVPQITAKLQSEGYKVRSVKAQGSVYEFKGFDPQGKRLETEVDPVSGTVLGTDSDD